MVKWEIKCEYILCLQRAGFGFYIVNKVSGRESEH
jgi:hypothetical protein